MKGKICINIGNKINSLFYCDLERASRATTRAGKAKKVRRILIIYISDHLNS